MPDIAVFASGNGSNFQSIVEAMEHTSSSVRYLICDNPKAYVLERAGTLSIPAHVVPYYGLTREETEVKFLDILESSPVDLIVLAGFMKILSPFFLSRCRSRIINIHPSLLPKYPGTDGIRKSFDSGDTKLGVTIHYVDEGVDTGKVIAQESFTRNGDESMEEIEERIHRIEHRLYPEVILHILDKIDNV